MTYSSKRVNPFSDRIQQFSEYQSVLEEDNGLLDALAYELDEKGINKVFKDITGLQRKQGKNTRPKSQQKDR